MVVPGAYMAYYCTGCDAEDFFPFSLNFVSPIGGLLLSLFLGSMFIALGRLGLCRITLLFPENRRCSSMA